MPARKRRRSPLLLAMPFDYVIAILAVITLTLSIGDGFLEDTHILKPITALYCQTARIFWQFLDPVRLLFQVRSMILHTRRLC